MDVLFCLQTKCSSFMLDDVAHTKEDAEGNSLKSMLEAGEGSTMGVLSRIITMKT